MAQLSVENCWLRHVIFEKGTTGDETWDQNTRITWSNNHVNYGSGAPNIGVEFRSGQHNGISFFAGNIEGFTNAIGCWADNDTVGASIVMMSIYKTGFYSCTNVFNVTPSASYYAQIKLGVLDMYWAAGLLGLDANIYASAGSSTILIPSPVRFFNYGNATLTSGNTYIDVEHEISITPQINRISVTPQDDLNGKDFWVSNVNSTHFRINIDSTDGSNHVFGWTYN